MPTIFIKVITTGNHASAESQLKSAIQTLLNDAGVYDVAFTPLSSYWKSPECSELNCQITTNLSLETIQKLFADTWLSDTADIRWSVIHLPHTSFLWISA